MREFVSHKAAQFTESVIREMSRVAAKHKAVNLAQGSGFSGAARNQRRRLPGDYEQPQPIRHHLGH
jgi:hypothetical protein